ncbi:MAG: TolC family protein [Gemmatimonadota bacterium]
MIRVTHVVLTLLTVGAAGIRSQDAHAQTVSLESLLAEADSASPQIEAARSAAESAAARVPQAGALPDPMIGIGFMNIPVADPGLGNDMMTMTQLQVSTRLPWPGKLGLQEDIAGLRAETAEWEVRRVRDRVRADVKAAYFEIYFVDRAIAVTTRNGSLLADFADLTAVRYGVGTGRQPDVLKAQVERTRLADQGVVLRARRVRAEARLNALLGRPSNTRVPATELPEAVRLVALDDAGTGSTFTSAVLDTSALDDSSGAPGTSSLPSLAELQRLALEHSPAIRAQEMRVAAEERTRSLAGTAKRPDVSVSAGYSFRRGLGDFFNVMVSAPVPIFAGRKQNQGVVEAEALVEERRSALSATIDAVNGEIASLAADLRRARDQLTLLNDGILPQARTGLSSATASYRVGGVDFLTLLDAQVTLFRHELDYHRLLSDFATNLAALERAVGTEVLR